MEKNPYKPVDYRDKITDNDLAGMVSEPVAEYIRNATGEDASPEVRNAFQHLRRILIEDRALLQKLAQ